MLNFMSYSILFAITSNSKLYVITYNYNHYIIIQITNLMWIAWSEQYQTNTENLEISVFICMQ